MWLNGKCERRLIISRMSAFGYPYLIWRCKRVFGFDVWPVHDQCLNVPLKTTAGQLDLGFEGICLTAVDDVYAYLALILVKCRRNIKSAYAGVPTCTECIACP